MSLVPNCWMDKTRNLKLSFRTVTLAGWLNYPVNTLSGVIIRSVDRKWREVSWAVSDINLPFDPDSLSLNLKVLGSHHVDTNSTVITNKNNCLVSLLKEQRSLKVSDLQTLNMCLFSTFLSVNLFTCGFSPRAAFFCCCFLIRQIINQTVNLSLFFFCFSLNCKTVELVEALV